MQDIAILTGANVVSEDTGSKLENIDIDVLIKLIKCGPIKTAHASLVEKGNEKIIALPSCTKKPADASTSDFDKEKLLSGLAKLTGGGSGY